MTVEAVAHISDLNATYPAAGDNPQEGDDHIRNIKLALRADFPNITGPVTATQAQLNAAASGSTGGLVLLATASASASAAIDFTTGIDGTYEEYEFHIINAVAATAGVVPWLRTSANGGTSFDAGVGDYSYTYVSAAAGAVAASSSSTSSSNVVLGDATPQTSATIGGWSGVVRIFDPAGTVSRKRMNWSLGANSSNLASGDIFYTGSGSRFSTAALNAIRFLFSSGNIASGKFKLYGVKK